MMMKETGTPLKCTDFMCPERKYAFSVQSYLGQNIGSFLMEGDTSIFTFLNGDKLTFKTYHVEEGCSQLPLAYHSKAKAFWLGCSSKNSMFNVLSRANVNFCKAKRNYLDGTLS